MKDIKTWRESLVSTDSGVEWTVSLTDHDNRGLLIKPVPVLSVKAHGNAVAEGASIQIADIEDLIKTWREAVGAR